MAILMPSGRLCRPMVTAASTLARQMPSTATVAPTAMHRGADAGHCGFGYGARGHGGRPLAAHDAAGAAMRMRKPPKHLRSTSTSSAVAAQAARAEHTSPAAMAGPVCHPFDRGHRCGRPGPGGCAGEGGAHQPGGDGGEQGFFLHVAVFQVGGEGGGRGGQEIEQVDPLGQGLGHPGKAGHVDEQQRAAAHPEAGQHPGGRPRQGGDDPLLHSSAFTPPYRISRAKPRRSQVMDRLLRKCFGGFLILIGLRELFQKG